MDKGLKTALIIGGVAVGVIVIAGLVSGLVSGWGDTGFGMMGPGIMGGLFAMFLMPLAWIVVIGLIVWAVVASVRKTGDSGGPATTPDSPLEILKKRYARGEISKEEFERMKNDLT